MVQIIDPETSEPLKAVNGTGLVHQNGDVASPWNDGTFRLAPELNYSENFGRQWNDFKKTQIDKFSGVTYSKTRFFKETEWSAPELKDQNILEVGSGAGRFTRIVLDKTEANLFSLDYSTAVNAHFENNGPHERLNLFQCSLYDMPFESNSFDKAFCLGVISHTPDVKKTLAAMVDKLKPGGQIVVDFYPVNGWCTKVSAEYMLRPFTRKLDQERLRNMIENNVDWMIALSRFFNKIGIGKLTNRFIPVVDITTIPPDVPAEDFRQLVVLDTFDVYSPAYDQPQSLQTMEQHLHDLGMVDVFAGRIDTMSGMTQVVLGTKP